MGALVEFKQQVEERVPAFAEALPKHIDVGRFKSVLLTAVTNNPDLERADRHSLWVAAMKAAQDGLLPDGREGVIVIYKTSIKRDGKEFWIAKAQWQPMVWGI